MTLLAKSPLLPGLSSFYNEFFENDKPWGLDYDNSWMRRVPSANVLESDNDFIIELAAPGLVKDDFKVNIENDQIIISSEKENEEVEEKENYTRKEFNYHAFSRSFMLPDLVDTDKIKAKYENGLLRIALPKKPEAKKMRKKAISIG
jgi:HSP20 family protein